MKKFVLLMLPLLLVEVSPLQAGKLVQFRTRLGPIDVELFDLDKPVTVSNFLSYVQDGSYDRTFLHRCVPGFIVQGGGFGAFNPASTNEFEFNQAFSVVTRPTITNEYLVGRRFSNLYGTIAMAKLGSSPDSATSQWFFNLANNSTNLDNQNGGFTVFGQVVAGTNVLNYFNTISRSNGIVDLQWWYGPGGVAGIFSDLPVDYRGLFYPRFTDLFYVNIVPLELTVQKSAGGIPLISWSSFAGRTNVIEYRTSLFSPWQLLVRTNATGNVITIQDTNTSTAQRFYRARVLY